MNWLTAYTSETSLVSDAEGDERNGKGVKGVSIGLLASEMCTRGGVQSFMLRLAELQGSMVESGEACFAWCVSLNDRPSEMALHPAIPAVLTRGGAGRSKMLLILKSLLSLPRVDSLIVGHLGLAPLAMILKRLGRVKRYYVILHGIEAWKRSSPIKRAALRRANKLVATTRFTAEECGRVNELQRGLFEVIPLCADERTIASDQSFELRGEFKLLCVSRQDRTEEGKGFLYLFRAIARLCTRVAGIHLNMVGMGNAQYELKEEVERLGIADRVSFWGQLSDAELMAAYQLCDLFVLPSRKEGFGIVFLEAMRFGKPCVGGNHGGTPEVIDHGQSGFLVEYGDVPSLAEAIAALANDPHLKNRMGSFGKSLVESRFSKAAFNAAYVALISNQEEPRVSGGVT